MIPKTEINMPKQYFWIWLVLFLSLTGFVGYFLLGDYIGIIYEETKQLAGNTAEFTFTLPSEKQNYTVIFVLDYDCKQVYESVRAKVISPTGREYVGFTNIGERRAGQCAIKEVTSFSIKNVNREEGVFKAVIIKEGNKNNINKLTLKIKKEK